MQPLQNPIALGAFRLIENVKTAEPGCEGETGQQQDRQRPGKIIDALMSRPRVGIVVRINSVGHLGGIKIARVHAGLAVSKDERQPHVRDAFGFTIWKPTPVKPSRKSSVASLK